MNLWKKHLALGVTVAVVGFGTAGILRADPKKKEKKDEKEVKISLDDVPAEVKATIVDESKGGKIDEVEKETDDGETVYEADATIGKHKYEIKVAEDGTLLVKKLEKKDDDNKEKDDMDEKEEKK